MVVLSGVGLGLWVVAGEMGWLDWIRSSGVERGLDPAEPAVGLRVPEAGPGHDDAGNGERPGPGEAIEDHAQAESLITVAMRDEDSRQVLPAGGDPVAEAARLGGGHQRVDQDCVPLGKDERRGYRRPSPLGGGMGRSSVTIGSSGVT